MGLYPNIPVIKDIIVYRPLNWKLSHTLSRWKEWKSYYYKANYFRNEFSTLALMYNLFCIVGHFLFIITRTILDILYKKV